MVTELLALYRKGKNFDALEALCARLVLERDAALLEAAKLRKENRYLRHKLRQHELRMLRRAEVDATLLGCLFLAGLPTSRRECETMGMSRRRWAWARALLMAARVLDSDGWCVDDAAAFDTRLGAGVRLVEAQGMGKLRGYLPRNGYAGRRFPRPGHAARSR